ncbi:MAG: winged helix-turn-helix domain-containing protein [Proteobacteria bacterium]|nr:winged helix-turn-helix domain-containing protein [Pseudomonadota bacterium]
MEVDNIKHETVYPARFYLADWLVDSHSNRLQKDGVEVKLESKAMEVLTYLAQHQGGPAISREQLEQAVWGNTIVGYDALTSCIAKLRKVLNDDARQPQYIETIAKKGYRLIAPVSSLPPDDQPDLTPNQIPASQQPNRRKIALGLVILIALVTILLKPWNIFQNTQPSSGSTTHPSIVVLPFDNLNNNPDQRYFSDGVTADITTALSKLSGLFVISRTSANHYRSRVSDANKVASSLGVRYLLEGSIRHTGNRIRVNVHLIDAERDIHIWSEKYDRELDAVFEVQDEITASIVKALSVKLTKEEKHRTARKYTTSIKAYDDLLRGRALYGQRSAEQNQLARKYYQQAIDRDANFSLAHSAMAITYAAEYRYGWSRRTPELLDTALELARNAAALDDNIPQTYWALGYVHLFRREYDEATKAASRAIELDPNYADSYLTLAICKIYFNEPKEALNLIRKAMLLNPEYPAPYASVLGQAYFFMGQYERAIPVLREVIDRNISLLTAHVFLIASLNELGRTDDAVWAAAQLKGFAPGFSTDKVADMLPVQNSDVVDHIKKHLRTSGM